MDKTLCAALVSAQKTVRAVQKDSKNKFHNYDYASAEDVIVAARHALTGAGLALIASGYTVEPGQVIDAIPEKGKTQEPEDAKPRANLRCEYVLVHVDGGFEKLASVTPIIPEKGRPADKAVATAKTYDLSYTLRGLLLMARGVDDDDPDARNDNPEPEPERERARGSDTERSAPRDPGSLNFEQVKERAGALARKIGVEHVRKLCGVPDSTWTEETWRNALQKIEHEYARREAAKGAQ